MTDSIPTGLQLYHFVDDLEKSLSEKVDLDIDCDEIILCGVGGSAVSGDFAADCCYEESKVPIRLIRYPDLPEWADSRTLAVLSSYSGNTAETLEMYRQAKARGCRIVVITSGGILMDKARAAGDDMMPLPVGMHPRHAIGYMIGYTLAVIRCAGGPDLSDRIKGFIPALREYRDSVSSENGQAMAIVEGIMGTVPVICSDSYMRSVAFRWKTQVNENSKFVAFCESEPELRGHIGAWSQDPRRECTVIVLRGDIPDPAALDDDIASMHGDQRAMVVHIDGATPLENMFRAIILGDYVSVHMAGIRGIDAAEVKPVMQMKAKLRELGY